MVKECCSLIQSTKIFYGVLFSSCFSCVLLALIDWSTVSPTLEKTNPTTHDVLRYHYLKNIKSKIYKENGGTIFSIFAIYKDNKIISIKEKPVYNTFYDLSHDVTRAEIHKMLQYSYKGRLVSNTDVNIYDSLDAWTIFLGLRSYWANDISKRPFYKTRKMLTDNTVIKIRIKRYRTTNKTRPVIAAKNLKLPVII